MKVYKFGGASLKTSKAIENMKTIVCDQKQGPLLVIVSAMGKSTNLLEKILNDRIRYADYSADLIFFKKYHSEICQELFPDPGDIIFSELDQLYRELETKLDHIGNDVTADESYDAVVSFGELFSSLIVSHFLNSNEVPSFLLDARSVIKTDNCFKEGKIQWEETCRNIRDVVNQIDPNKVIISQGFIGSTKGGKTTTLGREGSDFTAAIFASCLDSEEVTFWKDVPGIMNADPKLIPDALMIDQLPYQEAAEMTYYGAKVIHPKTIRPLANRNIPLYVKGFDHPDLPGTCIKEFNSWKKVPVVIYKKDQFLVSCKFTDFSFVNEASLVKIFDVLHELDIKVNMMQNSAISFSVCIDMNQKKTDNLIEKLSLHFKIHYNSNLTLVTIKNINRDAMEKYKPKENILLEQQTRSNYMAVIKEEMK